MANNATMLWMLVFFVAFYFYIDIKVNNLRKELLAHYVACENMISSGDQLPSSTRPLRLVSTSPYETKDHFTNLSFNNMIPSKEETAYGLSNLKCTENGCQGTEWLSDSTNQIGSGFYPDGLQAYNINSDSLDNYAAFP
jgi:hypothetical protein